MHRTSPHFRTKPDHFRLAAAFAASLALHLLPLLPALISPVSRPAPAVPPPLQVELRPAAPPPLQLPETADETPPPPPPRKPRPPQDQPPPAKLPGKAAPTWTQAVRQHLKKLERAGQFYPAEAIARGLQGEVEVLLVIDESGKVAAARIERGSGHAILDEAALRAVRSLTSLPADAPRQVVLPVRFRLR